MKKLAAVALLALSVIAVAPSAAAEPSTTALAVIAPTPVPYVPQPYVSPIVEQFQFLGYKVSQKAVDGKPSARDRSEVKRFQSKFALRQTGKVDKTTLKAANKYAGDTTVPTRCLTGKWTLCINKYNRTLQAINPDGSIAKVMDVRFGMQGLETREGNFRIQRKGGYGHMSTLYKVNMPYPMFFSGGQAVHFSWEFSRYPNTKSHGCIGTRDLKAQKWLWERSPVGTPVIVFDKAPRQAS